MTEISGEVEIRREPEVVFATVADERNSYDRRHRSAELLTGEPVGLGSRFRSEIEGRGRTVVTIVEITEYEPPHRLSTTTQAPGLDVRSTLRFEPVAAGTRLRWSSELRPRGLMNLLRPLLGVIGRRQSEAIWSDLKRALEAPDGAT